MSNSTPQGPGPEFGSAPDASPIDDRAELEAEMAEETAAVEREGGDDTIDISEASGPDVSGGDDVS